MPKIDYAAFQALDPFFEVVMEGLSKFVDGEHYFDTLAGDVLFEFLYQACPNVGRPITCKSLTRLVKARLRRC